jgi:hypothetical protein
VRTIFAPCDTCTRFRDDFCHGYEKPRKADDTNAACPLFNERKLRKAEGASKGQKQRQKQRQKAAA